MCLITPVTTHQGYLNISLTLSVTRGLFYPVSKRKPDHNQIPGNELAHVYKCRV